MWRQLRGAFRIKRLVFSPIIPELHLVEQYPCLDEALASCQGQRVFLEPNGERAVSEIPSGDIVLVLGNTPMSNMAIAKPEETYKINSEQGHLYGTNAAAIALAIRYGQ